MIIPIPSRLINAAKRLAPGIKAAINPKVKTIRIAAMNARTACIEEDISANGVILTPLISLISTIFSPPFTISVISYLLDDILIFRFQRL